KTILSNIGYTPFGAIQSWTWGNSTSADPLVYKREFDTAGRITTYPLDQIGSNGNIRTLNYDAADRIKSFVHRGEPNAIRFDQHFTYDDLDRLTRVEGTTISQAFEYDANGNRIRARFGAGVATNAISPTSNRLTGTSGPAPAKTNTFDNAGNLTSDGYIKYMYGTNGRLVAVDRAGVDTSYQYNGFGQRVAKAETGGKVTYYVYDLAGRLLGEYDQDGNVNQETVYLGDLPVAVLKRRAGVAPGQAMVTDVYNVYADHILTPRVITRSSDNRMVWRWDNADPFGLQQPDESPGGLARFTYNLRFPGQVYDKETNNHYNYYRDYDPQMGRYVQSDPIGLSGGINTYGYVGGNPLSSVDPAGLFGVADLPLLPEGLVGYATGYRSYYGGLINFAAHLARRSGFDGDCEQKRAEEEEIAMGAAFGALSDQKIAKEVSERVGHWASENKAHIAGRLSAGVVTGMVVREPRISVGLTTAAAMGDALDAIRNGADNAELILRGGLGEQYAGLVKNARTKCGCEKK
ncbi:MAG TPA: RHS repeat-associated core domain-containing protein, partial [Telluria sp.]